MKPHFTCAVLIFLCCQAYAQTAAVRRLHSKFIGKDSVNLFFNNYYEMIEDTCATIIRFGHYDTLKHHFMGKFKDVSAGDRSQILGTGNYAKDGLKNGPFIFYYPNGKLEAKGDFKNNVYEGEWMFYYANGNLACRCNFRNGQYDGKCEFYYENGHPYTFMKVSNITCVISDVWLNDGTKIVDKGNGYCSVVSDAVIWHGKLTKGLPDSVWSYSFLHKLAATKSKVEKSGDMTVYDNISSEPVENVFGNETFKDGQFVRGQNGNDGGSSIYTDYSRILFLPKKPRLRAFRADDWLMPSRFACDGTNYYLKYGILRFQLFN